MISDKLKNLLFVVVEIYIQHGDPIGSKALCNYDRVDYAPSTIRKYLNQLEKEWYLYQPYHSAGRLPTKQWVSLYVDDLINETSETNLSKLDFDADYARSSLKFLVEKIGDYIDGVGVGFLRNDEYYFLWVNNLLKEDLESEYEDTRKLVKYVEEKEIIWHMDEKILKSDKIYYDMIDIDDDTTISTMYVKITIKWYDGILAVVGHMRADYKKNLTVLKKFITMSKKTIK